MAASIETAAAGSNPDAVARAAARAVDFEVSLAEVIRRSERRAWWVAAGATAVAIALAGGYVVMLPLKERVPFLVIADPFSGTASVARLREDALDQTLTASEALNRAHAAQFVTMRESYDHAVIRLREWRTVHSMSSPGVAAEYSALYAQSNPESPDRVHGAARSIRVRILSVVLIGGDDGRPPRGATVRFQRNVYDKRSAASRPLDSRIATFEFEFNPRVVMSDADRLQNPLGFQVTSYRTDEDFAPLPAEAVLEESPPALTGPVPAQAPAPATSSMGDAP